MKYYSAIKNECIWVSSNEVDEPGAYYTELSKSERERQILYNNTDIWRRQWHPIPVLLPGKSHGRRSLVGCSHEVAKSRTQLSNFTLTFHIHALEKEMATHSSVLAWRIPRTGEPGRLLSMGSHRVGHD